MKEVTFLHRVTLAPPTGLVTTLSLLVELVLCSLEIWGNNWLPSLRETGPAAMLHPCHHLRRCRRLKMNPPSTSGCENSKSCWRSSWYFGSFVSTLWIKKWSQETQFQRRDVYCPSSPLSSCPESGLSISISLAELALAELVGELAFAELASGDLWPSVGAAAKRSGACKCW